MIPVAKGFRALMAYAVQNDPAVIPTANWKELPYVSTSLTATYETTQSETIRDTRVQSKGMVSKASAQGDVTAEFFYGTYDDFMAGAAYSEWANNVLTFGGTTEKIFAIDRFNKDVGISHLFLGCAVNTFKMSVSDGKLLDLVFGLMARSYQNKSDDTQFASAIVSAGELTPASVLTVKDFKINGALTNGVACVKAFDLEVNNNITQTSCIGTGDIFAGGLAEMKQTVTGNLTLAYGKQSQEYVNAQIKGDTLSIEFTVHFEGKGDYTFNLPNIQVSGDVPSGGGGDILDQAFTFTAVSTPITITRVPAV